MSELAIRYDPIEFVDRPSTGLSPENLRFTQHKEYIYEETKVSISFYRRILLEEKFKELYGIYRECSSPNWDGYDANPITKNTLNQAIRIMELLSNDYLNLSIPDIVPEPDGDIAFEWEKNDEQTFVFSINENKTINYAGIFGPNTVHGNEMFIDTLPPAIVYNLNRLNQSS